MVAATLVARGLASSTMVRALARLYNTGPTFHRFLDDHLVSMQRSQNTTIERSGRVLEGCKAGFGIGYAAPVVIIAAGQVILGNPLHAVGTVASAVTLTNPVAMTCAAVGAVLYGYNALSEKEREALLSSLADGLRLGTELIRSILAYAIASLRALLTNEQMADLRRWVKEAAESLGRHLGDVTRLLKDRVLDGISTTAGGTIHLVGVSTDFALAGAGAVVAQSSALVETTKRAVQSTYHAATGTVKPEGSDPPALQPDEPEA